MPEEQPLVYLNGKVLPAAEATIPIDDRGFMLADGIYEVIRVSAGRPFLLHRHLARLQRSAALVQLTLDPGIEELERVCHDMVKRQGLMEASIYMQVTRGSAPRAHAIPHGLRPTTLVRVTAVADNSGTLGKGVSAITVPDDRWARCDAKTISLIANVLAKQRAAEVGAFEAIFVRDGVITDAASSNVFAVFGSVLMTAPRSNYILAGITREVILELARAKSISVKEEVFRVEDLRKADEIMVTGTVTEIVPVTKLDGAAVGTGAPGPIYGRLQTLFDAFKAKEVGAGQ